MSTWTVTIGGMVFHLHYDAARLHLKEAAPVYQPFILRQNDEFSPADMEVELQLDRVPATAGEKKIFDSGDALRIYKNDNGYLVSHTIPGEGNPEWLAEISPDFCQAKIYCGIRMRTLRGKTSMVTNPLQYPLDQIFLMFLLARKQGALIHGAGISRGDRGYIFPGPSGAGKSTLMKQFFHEGAWTILSDDRMVLRSAGGHYTAYGTPWAGEGGWAENFSVPLQSICFVQKGVENRVTPVSSQAAAEALLPVMSIPWYDASLVSAYLAICEDIIRKVPTYRLEFRPEVDICRVFENFFYC